MEMVHRENNKDGKFYFGIYDVLVRHWIDCKQKLINASRNQTSIDFNNYMLDNSRQ